MRTTTIRARGQSALFAGIVLAVFGPTFRLAALLPTGYASALAESAATKNYGALLAWAAGNVPLVAVTAALQAIPFAAILVLPLTLRRAVFGAGGRVPQWVGFIGLMLLAILAIVDLILLIGNAQQFASAATASRDAIGSNYRFTAFGEALIANVLGGGLVTFWLVAVNIPLARLGGFERWVGFAGVAGAALFGASALLTIFDPQQPQGAVAGTADGWFGFWLILVGILLLQRAPRLGVEADSVEAEPEAP